MSKSDSKRANMVPCVSVKYADAKHFSSAGRDIEVSEEGITGPYSTKVIIGEGMPIHGVPSESGKLKIQMKVKFPKNLTPEQKDQVNALLP